MEEFEKEIEKIKNKVVEIEKKYCFMKDYKLITTLLNKLNVQEFELTKEEIEKNDAMYMIERFENKVKIKQIKDKE